MFLLMPSARRCSPSTASISCSHQASRSVSRSGGAPSDTVCPVPARVLPDPGRVPGTAFGTGTSIVRTAGLSTVRGYSRCTRTCLESGSSTGENRMWLPCWVMSVSPARRARTRSRATASRLSTWAGIGPYRSVSSSRTATMSAVGVDRRDPGVGLQPQPLPGHVVVRDVRVDRQLDPDLGALAPGPPRAAPGPPRRSSSRTGRSRPRRRARTARRRAGCPRRGSPGPSARCACPRRSRCAAAMVASRSCAVSVSGFSGGYRK